ncbi:MAG: FAD-dependent oxidoreductase [Candidatus Thorarchaeota archaeon]
MDKLNRVIIGSNASIFQKIDPDSNVEVFLPTNEEEIKEAITFAREKNLPITTKGGGSGLSGACTGASRDKIVISTMRLKKVHEINFEKGYAIVDPGITPDELNEKIQKEKSNWKFFVAPSSRDIATIGGIMSTDGGGNDTWNAGTILDNVLAVELIDYFNNKIIVERESGERNNLKAKVSCSNKILEEKLQKMNFSLIDIAGSHGVLGILSKITVEIKSKQETNELCYTLVHADNLNAYGKVIFELIENNIPISYGEAIVEARHPDISGKTNPPMLIFEYTKEFDGKFKNIIDNISNAKYTIIDKTTFEKMKDIRVKMAKRNPPEGYQIALFEGYGVYGNNLLRFEEIINTINGTLTKNGFYPFIKFGHAPSIWHVGNKRIKGIIMHSREKRPENLTGEMVFKAIMALVDTCDKLDITPKPEHKWPYSKNTEKYKRLVQLTDIIGKQFNPFLLDCTPEELANLVL